MRTSIFNHARRIGREQESGLNITLHDRRSRGPGTWCRLIADEASAMVRASGSLVRFHFPVGEVVSDAERPGVLGGSKRFVVVECGAVGVLDGAQPGGEPGFAGGDGLAVGAAIGAFRESLAVAFDFPEVAFTVACAGAVMAMLAVASRIKVTVWPWGSRLTRAISCGPLRLRLGRVAGSRPVF
jgi:hypothetical protein